MGIHLVSSTGASVGVTRLELIARLALETGLLDEKRAKTSAWVKGQIVEALGVQAISHEQIDFDVADDGTPTVLSFENRWPS